MRRSPSPWLPFMLLAVTLLLLLLSGSGALAPLENVLGFIISPLEQFFSTITGWLGSLTQTSRDLQALRFEVEDLRSENEALVQENFRLREYQAENEELRRKLDFAQENPTYALVGADIVEQGCTIFPCGETVGQDSNPYLNYMIINAGSQDGIAVGMPVVTGGAALVGRIIRTSPNLSFVELITDPDSQLAAMLQQTRVTGIVEGSDDYQLVMTNILPDELVSVGETAVTSAIGGMLPRGLILGQVEEVRYQESQLFQEALLRPAIDFRRLETILVITDFPTPDLEELETE